MEAAMDADRSRLSFLGRPLPPPFERRVLVLAPGHIWGTTTLYGAARSS
jgi:hypothetical protein